MGADLHLKGRAGEAHDSGVQTLVQIGLGRTDIVFEAAEDRLIQIMHNAQHVIAVRHRIHDDAEGDQVENLVERLVLGEHFTVNAVGVLQAAVNHRIGNTALLHALHDLLIDPVHEVLVFGFLGLQRGGNFLIAHRVQIFQRQVFQFPLHALHTQAVGDGRIDLHGLEGLLLLLGRRLEFHGAHIVQTVCHFDQHHAHVLAHGHQHFAQVFHLLLRLGGKLHAVQLTDAIHQISHGGGEQPAHLFMAGAGILNGVMQQRCHDGFAVQMQLASHDHGHRQRMGHIRRSIFAQLTLMGIGSKLVCRADQRKVGAGIIAAYRFLQLEVALFDCHLAPPLFEVSKMP